LLRYRRNRGTSGSELRFAHAALLAAAGALNMVLVLAGVLRQQADDCVEACATKPPIGGEVLDGLAGGEFVGHCAGWSDRPEVDGRRLAAAVRLYIEADSLTIIELLLPRLLDS